MIAEAATSTTVTIGPICFSKISKAFSSSGHRDGVQIGPLSYYAKYRTAAFNSTPRKKNETLDTKGQVGPRTKYYKVQRRRKDSTLR